MLIIVLLLITTFCSYSADFNKRKTDFISAREYYQTQLALQKQTKPAAQKTVELSKAELDALCEGIDFGSDQDTNTAQTVVHHHTQAEIDALCEGIDFGSNE